MGYEEVVDQLIQDLQLDDNQMVQKDPILIEQVKALVCEYSNVLSSPKQEIGKTSLIQFSNNLKPVAKPVK